MYSSLIATFCRHASASADREKPNGKKKVDLKNLRPTVRADKDTPETQSFTNAPVPMGHQRDWVVTDVVKTIDVAEIFHQIVLQLDHRRQGLPTSEFDGNAEEKQTSRVSELKK